MRRMVIDKKSEDTTVFGAEGTHLKRQIREKGREGGSEGKKEGHDLPPDPHRSTVRRSETAVDPSL